MDAPKTCAQSLEAFRNAPSSDLSPKLRGGVEKRGFRDNGRFPSMIRVRAAEVELDEASRELIARGRCKRLQDAWSATLEAGRAWQVGASHGAERSSERSGQPRASCVSPLSTRTRVERMLATQTTGIINIEPVYWCYLMRRSHSPAGRITRYSKFEKVAVPFLCGLA